ncbi:MAG: arsenical pump-driving ATPase [Bacteroidales bacterium]|jgi:arsenite-transporting ATPase|nr:arsenical pump-driving ATPase [Bacteroidales bacterium]
MRFLKQPTRLLFFTGKGGVGKTSLACATAITLADEGRKVLLVSTDPASNLGQVFGVTIGEHEPTPIPGVTGLFALNINPEAAAQAYRDRIVGPVRDVLPAETVKGMEEQLSGACTTEIAAFDEFTGLLTDGVATGNYDHVIFDTAPTGHTLRLLQLPTAWSNFLETNESGASCLGPLSGLEKQRQQYAHAVAELANADTTTVVLVSRPQKASLAEADRTSHELATLGIVNQHLVINGVMPENGSDDPLANALRGREEAAMSELPKSLAALPTVRVPLQPRNMVGIAALRDLLSDSPESSSLPENAASLGPLSLPTLSELIDVIEADGHGLVMVLGKGGVGKTTVAAAVAVALAARGHAVHLTTTDPAAHLSMTVESSFPNLTVSRIDPQVERDRYRQHVIETKGQNLDEAGRKLLEEDLRSPCTEEIAVFQAFSRIMRESREKFVVVDTAPTGHTLLLLDATGSYHRDVVRHLKPGTQVVTPMMRLQDPSQTKMLIVTLPETTPVSEAESLQNDLRRAGIDPWAWVINSSLAAASPSDPLLVARASEERQHIKRVQEHVARVAIIPWLAHEPVGGERLLELARPKAGTCDSVH